MGVGYKLYRQIRDHAPQNWTSGELVVALMIADHASDSTRRATRLSAESLGKLCRMSPRGVRKNLEKLSERGFEFRVAQGKDGLGNTVYAVAGNGVEYQVPDIFMMLERGAAVASGLVENLAADELSTEPRRNHSTGWAEPQYRLTCSRTFSF